MTLPTDAGWDAMETALHCCWKDRTAKLNKSHPRSPHPAASIEDSCSEQLGPNKTRMQLSTAPLFIMANNLKTSVCPSGDERISKLQYIHVRGANDATPKIYLFGIRLTLAWRFKKRRHNFWKPSQVFPFVREIYIHKGNLHLKGCLPSLYQE